mmetsp:Transcript_40402/g.86764  ORF Transcript_40402/g.86764 Transcript_40402/m.86764 type:complete len:461 (+) Transcript_40402:167-1549(+)
MPPPSKEATSAADMATKRNRVERNRFEDGFPEMFKFYRGLGSFNQAHKDKVEEILAIWKRGNVKWSNKEGKEIDIPRWVAHSVVLNNNDRNALRRSGKVCMSLNHTRGYGCNRGKECGYFHECAFCGEAEHGMYQRHPNGDYICSRLRKWKAEEKKYEADGFGVAQEHEEELIKLCAKPRSRTIPVRTTPNAWNSVVNPNIRSPNKPVSGCSTASPPAASPGAPSRQAPSTKPARPPTPQEDETEDETRTRAGSHKSEQSESSCSDQPSAAEPALPDGWMACWSSEWERYFYWRTGEEPTWEAPVSEQRTRSGSDITDGKQEGEIKVCSQHWWPSPGDDENCIRVLQGERLLVTWAQGSTEGWAYGHLADDAAKVGYFPEAILEDERRPSIKRDAGEVCLVSRAFDAPMQASGYLNITPGESVKVLFPTEAGSDWAYVQKTEGDTPLTDEVGWVPEIVLQ